MEKDECRYSFHSPSFKKIIIILLCVHGWCMWKGYAHCGTCVTAKRQPCRLSTFMWIRGIKLRSGGLSDKCYPTKLSHPLCLPKVLKITSIFFVVRSTCGEQRTACRSWFSPSITWIPVIKLRWSGLVEASLLTEPSMLCLNQGQVLSMCVLCVWTQRLGFRRVMDHLKLFLDSLKQNIWQGTCAV